MLGVAPTQQNLEASHLAALARRRERLPGEGELATRRGLAQVALQHALLAQLVVHPGLEEGRAVLARPLRAIERGVGVVQQALRAVAVTGEQRDADRGRHGCLSLARADVVWFGQRRHEPLGERTRRLGLARVGLQHHELVPTQPGDGVGLAHAAGQPR